MLLLYGHGAQLNGLEAREGGQRRRQHGGGSGNVEMSAAKASASGTEPVDSQDSELPCQGNQPVWCQTWLTWEELASASHIAR